MAQVATSSAVRQIAALFQIGSMAGLPDRQLLERYATGGGGPTGEAAFAALVARHGPMVLGVCREILGDFQHAEDAFQAVFLVLARQARTIRDPDLLGNWLYGVAIRTARCARRKVARRRRREEGDAMKGVGAGSWAPVVPTVPPPDRPAIAREQAEALHEEVARLPRAFRAPVVLCYFEGLTVEEAARRLRCPAGTIQSRLSRARAKLRGGLARRGVVLPAAVLTALLAPRSASASVPPLLCDSTARAAITFAVRHAAAGGALSAPVAALAQEVLNAMLIHKLRLVVMTVLALAAVATGTGRLAHSLAMKEQPVPHSSATNVGRGSHGPAQRPNRRSPEREPARMTVAGRILDPDGKPVRGAAVDLIAWPRAPWVAARVEDEPSLVLLGRCESDGDGRFRLDAPRTSSSRVLDIYALATAPGHALGWAALNPDAEHPAAEIRLEPASPIRVRLIDLTGRPARNVEVRVVSFSRLGRKDPRDDIRAGVNPPEGVRTWPKAVRSDHDGRIVLTGFGPGVDVGLGVRDVPYARQDLHIDTGKSAGKETTLALAPARIIEGRVLAADTGRPLPGAIVSTTAFVETENARGYHTAKFRADAQGRFVMNMLTGESYAVGAFPAGGEPYLIQQDEFPWSKGAVRATHDIKVRRGVLIRGKVTEVGTGRPLPASSIQFIPVGRQGDNTILSGWQAIVASRDDGSFAIAVPPGKGYLLVFGPTSEYVLEATGQDALDQGLPAGRRHYAHRVIPYEVKAGDAPRVVAAALRPGATIGGRVEGPDGQTIVDAQLITTLYIESFNPFWRGDFQLKVRDGRFEVHGVDPEGSARVYILQAEHEWGAMVDVSGKQAGKDLTIRLEPCGRARARFVGPDGKPVATPQPRAFELVANPGPSQSTRGERDGDRPGAEAAALISIDRRHYKWDRGPRIDDDGRFTLDALIPSALYRIINPLTADDAKGAQVYREFTVEPGETIDLGDILIAKPRR